MTDFTSDEQLAKDFTIAILSRPNSFIKENPQEMAIIAANLYKSILAALKADKPEPGPYKPIRALH